MIFKNLLQIYALFICAVSSIILLISLGFSLNLITSLLMPEYINYSAMGRYESNEAYINFREERFSPNKDEIKNEVAALKQLPPEELSEKRIAARKDFLETNRRGNIQGLIGWAPWIFLTLFFFFIHWRIYKKAE